MNDDLLKPCPFCGSTVVGLKYSGEVGPDLETYRVGYVECNECGARTVGLHVTTGSEDNERYWTQTGFRVASYLWNLRD